MNITRQHTNQSHAGAVYALASGLDASTFFSVSADHYAVLWQLPELSQAPFAAKLEKSAYSILCIPQHHLLVVGNSEGAIHVIDLNLKQEIRMIVNHTKGIYDFAFDAADNQLLVAGGDGVLSVWSLPAFRLERTIPLSDQKLRQLSIDAANNFVAVACGDGYVRVLDLVFFNETATILAHEEGATSVAWHPNKPVLVSGGKDALLKCWNINNQFQNAMCFPAHHFAIYSIVFNSTGTLCATASRDKSIKIWDANSFEPLLKIGPGSDAHSHSVNKLLWLDKTLISCGDDRKICLFEIE